MSETFLFIDYETTGFKKRGAAVQDGQARACQVAMLMTDHKGRSLCEFSSLIKPDGWKIGQGARDVHGFTDDQCELYGLPFISALGLFINLAKKSDLIIAHNVDFDRDISNIEGEYYAHSIQEKWIAPATPWHCTMKTNTHLTGGKWPKLEEALQKLCGKTLGTFAHDAMYDVKACRDIFFANRGIIL